MDEQEYYVPVSIDPQAADAEGKTVLTLGIVASALVFTGIPGIILAIIGILKSKKWAAKYGHYTAKPRVGRILSIVALPSSIYMTLFWILYIALVGFAIWTALHTHTTLPQDLSLFSMLA